MDLLDFKTWTGTRSDLLAILQDFEMENPTQYGLVSKTGGKLLPVKQRRIQQFIDIGILPKPKSLRAVSTDNTHAYDFEHFLIAYYMFCACSERFTIVVYVKHPLWW